MQEAQQNSPTSPGALLSGALLGIWIAVSDGWIKVLARTGCCETTKTFAEALGELWTVPEACSPVDVAGIATLLPTSRDGASPFEVALPEGTGAVWGLALFALATVLTILILRWSRRSKGDVLILGTLWSGACVHGLPRLLGSGASFAELQIASLGFGVGDLALAWALVWLTWRFIAEQLA